jgi:hypothetical protein
MMTHHDITIVVGCKGWNYKLDGEDGIVGEKMDSRVREMTMVNAFPLCVLTTT